MCVRMECRATFLVTNRTRPSGWCCTPDLHATCLIFLIKERRVGIPVNKLSLFVPHMVNVELKLHNVAILPFEFEYFLYQPSVPSVQLGAGVLLHGHELCMAHDHARAPNVAFQPPSPFMCFVHYGR